MERLIVPVYINQKIVFDLLAMLQNGISTVASVTESISSDNSEKEKISSGFGLNDAFSTLFKINLSKSKDKEVGNEQHSTLSQERIHTPASLLFQLRNLLIKEKYLSKTSDMELPEAGSFVEFEGFLKRNPIVEIFDSLTEMTEFAEAFEDKQQQKKGGRNQPSELQKIKKQMIHFSNSLKAGSTIDLTSRSLGSEYTAVVTVETAFLNDPLMSDIVDGQFKIIGKVIKSVKDSSDSINLLRKTAFSRMPADSILQIFKSLAYLGSEKGFDIPHPEIKVDGPAIQILPIAIYA